MDTEPFRLRRKVNNISCQIYDTDGGRGGCVPQSWSQDSIADDEVKFFQVGGWPVLKHAVAMETVLTISQALGNLQGMPPWCSLLCMWKLHQVLSSHLLCDLGFLLQGQRHQLVSNTVLLVAVTLRSLKRGKLRWAHLSIATHDSQQWTLELVWHYGDISSSCDSSDPPQPLFLTSPSPCSACSSLL